MVNHTLMPDKYMTCMKLCSGAFLKVFKYTYFPSSCPPRDTKYLSFGEKANASTLTLCTVAILCNIDLLSKSQIIITALNPMWVFSPEARYFPLLETAKQETAPLWPERSSWGKVGSSGVHLPPPLPFLDAAFLPPLSSLISSTTIVFPTG